ncbi:hypothetical protein E2C01_091369 [Portunus trituberculatus]|uniref:Uncharacterized protein n=1 Tax=Portunus trituberculatus TaxID=210409 RepID=A0A5B7JSQ1_PORTR|nr:hypothetical protein [Portunus trituberculatus]
MDGGRAAERQVPGGWVGGGEGRGIAVPRVDNKPEVTANSLNAQSRRQVSVNTPGNLVAGGEAELRHIGKVVATLKGNIVGSTTMNNSCMEVAREPQTQEVKRKVIWKRHQRHSFAETEGCLARTRGN